jgi:hypothetical protein
VVLVTIWLLGGAHRSFWPAWAIVPWGAVLLIKTLGGLATGQHEQYGDRASEVRREARQARRDARARRRDGHYG